jgi:hypothetical protein
MGAFQSVRAEVEALNSRSSCIAVEKLKIDRLASLLYDRLPAQDAAVGVISPPPSAPNRASLLGLQVTHPFIHNGRGSARGAPAKARRYGPIRNSRLIINTFGVAHFLGAGLKGIAVMLLKFTFGKVCTPLSTKTVDKFFCRSGRLPA